MHSLQLNCRQQIYVSFSKYQYCILLYTELKSAILFLLKSANVSKLNIFSLNEMGSINYYTLGSAINFLQKLEHLLAAFDLIYNIVSSKKIDALTNVTVFTFNLIFTLGVLEIIYLLFSIFDIFNIYLKRNKFICIYFLSAFPMCNRKGYPS